MMSMEGNKTMAETLRHFSDSTVGRNGVEYEASVCAAELPDGLWQAWIEFVPLDGGAAVHTARETTQGNRADVVYWASGLTAIYLEGALDRALNPLRIAPPVSPERAIFSEPASSVVRSQTGRHTKL
jgi:hypothetical protein